nr:hypothetical protein BaRGS_001649 [Batillaria attramentaria]
MPARMEGTTLHRPVVLNHFEHCRVGWKQGGKRCVAGRFGLACDGTCGRCLKGTCDHETGSAPAASTEPTAHFLVVIVSTTLPVMLSMESVRKDVRPGGKASFARWNVQLGFTDPTASTRAASAKAARPVNPLPGGVQGAARTAGPDQTVTRVLCQTTAPLHIESLLPAVVVVTVVVVLLSAIAAVYFLVIRPRSKPARLNRLYTDGEECGDPIRNAYEQMAGGPWDLPRSSLVLTTQQLGNGQFGQVKKGFVRMRGIKVPVAIKSLKENASEKDKRDFLNELAILKQVGKHPNVVCLVGACHIRGVMYVAMEYAKHGDLRTFLRKSRKLRQHEYGNCAAQPFVGKAMLLRFALDAAQGLRHLAEKQIIHRDVAARNVLLGDRLVAKIADFGLSKNDETYVKTSSTRVPIRWMAVESLFSNTYTTQSDVWSFGVVLWEVFTLGGTPYSSTDTQQLFTYLKDGYRLKRPRLCDQTTYAMMLQCWNENPERRPSFSELCGRLQRMLEDSQVYMNISTEEESLYAEIDNDLTT